MHAILGQLAVRCVFISFPNTGAQFDVLDAILAGDLTQLKAFPRQDIVNFTTSH
jgi:hypothetical protein